MVRQRAAGRVYRAFVLVEPEAGALAGYGLFESDALLAGPAVVAMAASATPQQRLGAFHDGEVLPTGGVPHDEYGASSE